MSLTASLTRALSGTYILYPEPVTVEELLYIVRDETTTHIEYYSQFLLESARDKLVEYMNSYIYDKLYNTPYGDLVPLVLANALNINIVIIYEGIQGLAARAIYSDSGDEAAGEILIFKSPDHYDGIIPKLDSHKLNTWYDYNVNHLDITGGASSGRSMTQDDKPSVHYNSESTGRSSYHISDDHTETCVSVAPTARRSVATGHTGSCVYDPNVIKICCWNLNGLTQTKLSKDLIGDYLSMFDLILLCETWAADDDNYELQGYTFYNYPRPFKHNNARRCSGGLGIFIRNSIINGVKILKFTKDMVA